MTDRSIAAEVIRRSDELSGALLKREGVARRRIGRLLTDEAVGARRLFAERAHKVDPSLLASDKRLLSGLGARMSRVIDATAGIYRETVESSYTLSAWRVAEQLLVMQRLNDAAHPDAGRWAAERVAGGASDYADTMTRTFTAAGDVLLGDFREQVRRQVRAGLGLEESVDMLERRLFHDGPVRRPQCSGRGVWWRPSVGLEARIVEGSIQAANDAQMAVLSAYNATLRPPR